MEIFCILNTALNTQLLLTGWQKSSVFVLGSFHMFLKQDVSRKERFDDYFCINKGIKTGWINTITPWIVKLPALILFLNHLSFLCHSQLTVCAPSLLFFRRQEISFSPEGESLEWRRAGGGVVVGWTWFWLDMPTWSMASLRKEPSHHFRILSSSLADELALSTVQTSIIMLSDCAM